jgi:protease-4
VRAAGKKVYAVCRSATNRDYLIATACDEIAMPPSGTLMVNGLQAEVMFYKGIFEKLGIKAEFMQVGNFKGAAEPYTRSEMSAELRQQLDGVLDDYFALMVETVAKDRKLDPGKVKDLIDEGLFTAARAKEAGLIDRVCYEDELEDQIKTALHADELKIEKDYGKKKLDTDFSGFAGFIKLLELMSGQSSSERSSKANKIAIIYAVGPIMDGASEGISLFENRVVTPDETIKAIRQAEEDKTVKAIVLRVDSPGGSALASDLIWRHIVKAKKPIIASMAGTAASGGYYISMGADKIVVEPGTLTGSIGVVGGKFAIEGLLNKLGVNTDVISRGKSAGVFSMTEPFSEPERQAWMRLMTDIYQQFTSKAAEGRKMELAKLQELAQGKIYTGRQAVAKGLADKLGTLEVAVTEAKLAAGLPADEKIEILSLPESKSFLDRLLEGPSAESKLQEIAPEVTALARKAAQLRALFAKPCATILPFEVRIR